MNILLTGGAGYIGSHTALSLIEKGNSVSIIDNLTTGSKKLIPNKAKYYKCDIHSYIYRVLYSLARSLSLSL